MEAASSVQVEPDEGVSPWLRWAGGKRKLAPRLVPEIVAVKPTLYIEPFLGGGAIALALPRSIPKILADVNPHLIDCWLCIQRIPGVLYKELDDVCSTYGNGPAGYVRARAEFNTMIGNPRLMWARRSALLMFLNARCFNGLWRTNARGEFNVPFGKIDDPRAFHWNELAELNGAIRTATLSTDSYVLTLGNRIGAAIRGPLRRGDVGGASKSMAGIAIYSDPPYDKTFAGYTKHGFDESDQASLANLLSSAAAAGAAVWASNNDTPLIRDLYKWAQIEAIDEHHSVGSKADRRGKRGCVLIRGGAAIRGS